MKLEYFNPAEGLNTLISRIERLEDDNNKLYAIYLEHEKQMFFCKNAIEKLIERINYLENKEEEEVDEGPFIVDLEQHQENLKKLADTVNEYALSPEFLGVLNSLPEIDADGSIMRIVEDRDIVTGKSIAELRIASIEANENFSDDHKKEFIEEIKHEEKVGKEGKLNKIKHERPHVYVNGVLQEDKRPGADLMWRYYNAVNKATTGSREDQEKAADFITSGIDKIKKEKKISEAIKNHNEKVAAEPLNVARAAVRKAGLNPDILTELDPMKRLGIDGTNMILLNDD